MSKQYYTCCNNNLDHACYDKYKTVEKINLGNSGFPLVRQGVWGYESVNYQIPQPGSAPVRFVRNIDLRFVSQAEGFIFINSPLNPSQTDTIAVWKKNNKNYDLYVTQDRPDNGTIIVSPTKYDKQGIAIEFKGIFVESGFQPGNPQQEPAAGQVRVFFKSIF